MNTDQIVLRRKLVVRLLVLLGLLALALVVALTTRRQVAHADVTEVPPGCELVFVAGDLDVSVAFVCPEEEGTGPDCGKNPYIWNPIGEHYQRRFNRFCEPFTGDPNEGLYHEMWFNETPLAD